MASQSIFGTSSAVQASAEENASPDRDAKMRRTEEPTIELDPEGDLILVIVDIEEDTQRYRVSSKILSLASKFFEKMFKAEFKEGIALRTGGNSEIALNECHRMAMDTILRIVHHQGNPMPKLVDPSLVAWVAIECERCNIWKPVLPYFDVWTRDWDTSSFRSPESVLGRMLIATWMAKIPRLQIVLEAAMDTFDPGFDARLSREPIWADRTEILGEVLEGIRAVELDLQKVMQRDLFDLAEGQPLMQDRNRMDHCTSSIRATVYMRALVSHGLWPMYEGSEHKSLRARFDIRCLPHECAVTTIGCPANLAWAKLAEHSRRKALTDVAGCIKAARFASRDSQGEQHVSPNF